jgi:ABC-2 type transport system ATP-binding protein
MHEKKGKQLNTIIAVENLTKKFNDFVAVDNVSFSVNEGEIFAFE